MNVNSNCPLSLEKLVDFLQNISTEQKKIVEIHRNSYYNERNHLISFIAIALVTIIAIFSHINEDALFLIILLIIISFASFLIIILTDYFMKKKLKFLIEERTGFFIDIDRLIWKIMYDVISDSKKVREEFFKILFHHSSISKIDYSNIINSQKRTIE